MKKDKQSDKFIETARNLGGDESEAAFKEKLRRLAPAKAKPTATKKPKKKKA